MNSLLNHGNILPTSGMSACTSTVCEISFKQKQLLQAEIVMLSAQEWYTELHDLLDDLTNDGELVTRRSSCRDGTPGAIAFDKVEGVYGRIAPFHTLRSNRRVNRLLERGTIKVTRSLDEHKEFAAKIKPYIISTTHEINRPSQVCFLVKKVMIRGPFPLLRTGVKLVDLPGLRDANAARSQVTEEFKKRTNFFMIASKIHRAMDDKTATSLLDDGMTRQLSMDGKVGNIIFVATQSDAIDPDETVRNNPDAVELQTEILPLQEQLGKIYADRLLNEHRRDDLDEVMRDEVTSDQGESSFAERVDLTNTINMLRVKENEVRKALRKVCATFRNRFW